MRIIAEGAAGRDLQSRRAEPRRGVVRGARVHRELRRARHAARCSRRSASSAWRRRRASTRRRPPSCTAWCSETPQTRDHAVLSALALRRGQALRVLDHGQLPRGLRHVRLQRHPLQPRVADPRRDLRHAQDHARAGAHQARPAGLPLPRQPRRAARLGPCARLRRGAVADAAAGAAPRTSSSPPASSTACASSSSAAARRARHGDRRGRARAREETAATTPQGRQAASSRVDPRYFRPTEVETLLGDASKARAEARLDAAASASASWSPRWCSEDLRAAERDALVQAARLHRLRPPRVTRWRRPAASTSPATAAWPARRSCAALRAAGYAQPGHAHATPSSTSPTSAAVRAFFDARAARSTCSSPRPRSAASSPTTPIRPISSARTCRSRPT